MPARAVGADEGVLGHVLALAPGGDVAPDQGRYPVLVLAHQQVERGAVAALHATDQFLVQVLSLLCVHDFGHRAGTPWGPAVRLGVMTRGCEGKFRGTIVLHLGPGCACHKPCRPWRGVSSADLTPLEHPLDEIGRASWRERVCKYV